MKKLAKKLSAMTVCAVFASIQIASASPIDTGLGNGLGGAVINNATGGLKDVTTGVGNASLNFNGSAHVNWDSLNLNKGETLNFNTVDGASGVTVLNSVNGGMSYIYGQINSDKGISKLIISNPSGMLYDGATFTSAGDVTLTTQPMALNGENAYVLKGQISEGLNTITIKDSNFNVGGEFNITASAINAINSVIKPGAAFKLSTIDGQNFTASALESQGIKKGVKLQSVSVNGDVYITTADGLVEIVDGGQVDGSLTVKTPGAVYNGKAVKGGDVKINYENAAKNKFKVGNDITIVSNSKKVFVHNTEAGGKLNVGNVGGSLEVVNIKTGSDVNLVTKKETDVNKTPKHFVHVGGNNDIGGDLNIDSVHNIHIGGYDKDFQIIDGQDWGTKVAGSVNAKSSNGSIAILKDVEAGEKINLTSDTLNIISNGKAVMKAKEYNFKAKGYIGGLESDDKVTAAMENYTFIAPGEKSYVIIEEGKVNQLDAPYAFVKANKSMEINNINGKMVNLTAGDKITIGENAIAERIQVEGDTKTLEVVNAGRDYLLDYTNIRDGQRIEITGDTEITAEMANGEKGLNINPNGRPNKTTYLVAPMPVVPDEPVVPPTEPTTPDDDNENVKVLRNLEKDKTSTAIDAGQIFTPVAFAADLDEEIDTGVRKNVDGSVTVVRPFTPVK